MFKKMKEKILMKANGVVNTAIKVGTTIFNNRQGRITIGVLIIGGGLVIGGSILISGINLK